MLPTTAMPNLADMLPGNPTRQKRLAISAAVFALAVVVAVVVWLLWQLRAIDANIRPAPATAAAVAEQLTPVPSQPSAEDTRPLEPTYVLVMGGREGEKAGLDTLLLARLDPYGSGASVLWIPPKAAMRADGDGEGRSASDAFRAGGPAAAIASVKSLTNLPVHHYVRFETNGLAEAVDAMGGVWVDPALAPDASFSPTEPPVARKGDLRLSGTAVLAYATRSTASDPEGGRDGLLVLNAALTQARDRLRTPGAIPLLLAASRSTETDMSSRGLLELGERMRSAADEPVRQHWLTGPVRDGRMRLDAASVGVRRAVGSFATATGQG